MEQDLTKGPVGRALMTFVLPFLASTILQFLYSVVDMMIVGRFTDPASISAVNTAGQMMQLVTTLIQGVATGGTVVIGQYVGGKQTQRIRRAVDSMLWVFLVMGLLFALGVFFGSGLLISLAKVPPEAVKDARDYLMICSLGIVFVSGYNGIAGILRGLGDSKHPMYFVVFSCGLNIVGDLLLVGAFRMGAAGAALATVLAQAVAFLLSVGTLQKSSVRFSRKLPGLAPEEGGRVLKLGIPLAAQDFLVNLSFLLITVVVNTMGVDKSAAVGIVERIVAFCMLVPIAFLSALSAFTAQNVGAHQPERARQGLKMSTLICALITLAILLLSEIIPGKMVGLFTTDAVVIGHGVDYFRPYALDIFLVSFVFCLNGFFSGYGRTGFTMANSLISTFVFRVPLVFAVSTIPDVSLTLIGAGAPVASVVQIVMQIVYYRVGSWRKLSEPAENK